MSHLNKIQIPSSALCTQTFLPEKSNKSKSSKHSDSEYNLNLMKFSKSKLYKSRKEAKDKKWYTNAQVAKYQQKRNACTNICIHGFRMCTNTARRCLLRTAFIHSSLTLALSFSLCFATPNVMRQNEKLLKSQKSSHTPSPMIYGHLRVRRMGCYCCWHIHGIIRPLRHSLHYRCPFLLNGEYIKAVFEVKAKNAMQPFARWSLASAKKMYMIFYKHIF